jgi:tRNA threonylcarbamoyladenosine biosynthesis protein TsaE
MQVVKLHSVDETKAFAAKLASLAQQGDVFTLQGDLGAGKSEFARAFIKSLAGQDTVVPSPTFTLLEQYTTPLGLISHFDLYRIESIDELAELGFDEALILGITLIEWPERLYDYHLPSALKLKITADPATEVRTVTLTADEFWSERLAKLIP